jgi:hypothetical protein
MLTRAAHRLTDLRAATSGVAMIEFAYSLPVVLTLALGGLEATNLALAHLRVSQVAMTTADNAARVPTLMDESDIAEVFAGADVTGRSLDFTRHGRVVLSSLQDNGQSGTRQGQTVGWQRCYGQLSVAPAYAREGAGANDATLRSGMGPAGRQITAQPGTAVMFVEVTYDYQPLLAGSVFGPIQIRYETALNVRERTNLGISNTQSRAVASCP